MCGEEMSKILVKVEADLEDLIPTFLDNRQTDIQSLDAHIADEDYEPIRIMGHSMKGYGSAYGFDEISYIGAKMEKAAIAKNMDIIKNERENLVSYLDNIVIEYI